MQTQLGNADHSVRKLLIAAASTGVLLLAACSHDAQDFKDSAEGFIESGKVETPLATTFTNAICNEPAKVEAGATFTCTAVDATGVTWDFAVVIESENSYDVTSDGPRP